MIVKLDLLRKHVDMSKIVAISDAYFIDRYGSGGYYVGFHIDVQLMDQPLKYERELEYHEQHDTSGYRKSPKYGKNGKTIAEINLQREIDKIIELWKEY